jgi:signal transduction histidine kinase
VSSTEQAVVIEVADSGAGVAPDVIDEVLRLGFSTKGTGTVGGRGLGLALVRQAVTRLGGTLTIGRRDGAVFTVTIPAIALPAAADTTAAPTPPETLAAAVDHD